MADDSENKNLHTGTPNKLKTASSPTHTLPAAVMPIMSFAGISERNDALESMYATIRMAKLPMLRLLAKPKAHVEIASKLGTPRGGLQLRLGLK